MVLQRSWVFLNFLNKSPCNLMDFFEVHFRSKPRSKRNRDCVVYRITQLTSSSLQPSSTSWSLFYFFYQQIFCFIIIFRWIFGASYYMPYPVVDWIAWCKPFNPKFIRVMVRSCFCYKRLTSSAAVALQYVRSWKKWKHFTLHYQLLF